MKCASCDGTGREIATGCDPCPGCMGGGFVRLDEAETCYDRSPLGAKCELRKGHDGPHIEEGWGTWPDEEPKT